MYHMINTLTHAHTHSLIPPREDQCEWHRITRMSGPDSAVMRNSINTHTLTHTQNKRAQDGKEDRSGDGAGTGTGMGTETRRQKQDGNGDGSRDGNESSSGDGNGDEDGKGNGNKDRIGEGEREAKKPRKAHRSCRRHVGTGGDLGGKRKKHRKERVGSVAANPDYLENNKEAGGGAQGTQCLSKNCTSR